MSRRDVTSSITTVQADKLNVGVYSDPAQLLQGKVPGLIVTQSSNPNGALLSRLGVHLLSVMVRLRNHIT